MSEQSFMFCEFCAAPLVSYQGGSSGTLGTLLKAQAQKCFCRIALEEAQGLIKKFQDDFDTYMEYNMPIGTSKIMMNDLVADMERGDPRRVELQQRMSYLQRLKDHLKMLREEKQRHENPTEIDQILPSPRSMPVVREGSLAALLHEQGKKGHSDNRPSQDKPKRRR